MERAEGTSLTRNPEMLGYDSLPWERKVALWSHTVMVDSLTDKLQGQGLPRMVFPSFQGILKILSEMYDLDRRTYDGLIRSGFSNAAIRSSVNQRANYYKNLAREIREKRRYYLFTNLSSVALDGTKNAPEFCQDMLLNDIATLHLMVSSPDRLLVGIKDGIYWKRIEWPRREGFTTPLLYTSAFFCGTLPLIGENELITVPEKPLTHDDGRELTLPKPSETIEDLLEKAYYGQRFIIPLQGAEVRFRKAGDLEKMIIIQSGDYISARVITTRGDTFVSLNINTGSETSHISGLFGAILAEVYRDMVTAIELPMNRFKTLKHLKTDVTTELREKPQVIYIPRIVRVKEREEIRPRYEGPSRPVTPHPVTGHRRKANMTEEQRQEIIKFERMYQLEVFKFLPLGFTFVKPHFVPADADIASIPVFIKRRIQTRLQEQLQRPTVKLG